MSFIGEVAGWDQPYAAANQVTPEVMARLVQTARSAGLTDWQIDNLFRFGSDLGANAATITDMIERYRVENATNAELDRQQQEHQAAVQEYDASLGRVQNRVQQDVNRYDRLLSTPGAARTDAEYGAALSSAEQLINAQVANAQRQAAQSTAASGLRSSGRSADLGLRAQEFGTLATQQAHQRMYGDILTNKQGARGVLDDIETQRGSIRLGEFPQFMDFGSRRLAGRYVSTPVESILTPAISLEAARRGENLNTAGLAIGTAQRGVESTQNFMTGLGGMFRN